MTEAELQQILEHCSCGRNHPEDGTGECDVPALVAALREQWKVHAFLREAMSHGKGAEAIRAAALEDAAKVAEDFQRFNAQHVANVHDIAAAIRALKEK